MSRQSHARIQAQITGTAKVVGPIEAHERNVLAITRRIHTLSRKTKTLQQQLKDARAELREKRRELRVVLQRDTTITEDSPALVLAGKADAVDAALAHAEGRR